MSEETWLKAKSDIRDAILAGVEANCEDEVYRCLALTDLWFLLVFVLGRRDADHPWVFDRCREVQVEPNGRLDLWAREHFKSTIITYALTIQDILNDPDITVGIFSFNRPTAKAFLRQIKREFESNEMLRRLFPTVIWENANRDAQTWGEDSGIVVQRHGNPKESTVEAWGLVDGQPTSKHFKLMVYDDVVTADSVTTPEMIEKVTRAWEASRNLTTEGGATRYIGTRWHFNDTYKQIIDRGAAIERRHAVTEDGTVEGKPVLWTPARVAEKRREMGPYTFSAQLLLDPTADRTQGFREEWIRYYESGSGSFSGMNKYLLVDPANEKKKSSDYTAMVVIGAADDGNYYLLDGIRDRLSLRERGDALFALHRRWRPKAVGYEKYGMQADISYHKERQATENYRFEIIELGGTLAKPDRIRRMIPIFEAGRFHLPETLIKVDYEGKHRDLVTAFLNEEYRPFPVGLHDDFFDAIARIVEPDLNVIWPKPTVPEVVDRYARPRKRPARRISHMAA